MAAVYCANGIQEAGMSLQFFTAAEAGYQLIYNILLFLGKLCGVLGVYGWEVSIPKGIFNPVYLHGALFIIHPGKHVPVLHIILRPALYQLSLQLKLYNAHSLMHTGEQHLVLGQTMARGHIAGMEHLRIAVYPVAEYGKMQQVYAVCVFQHIKVVILETVLYRHRNAGGAARRGAHPQHIMISPLNIHAVMLHKVIQYNIRVGTPVENVANDMQCIHRHALYEGAKCDYECIRNVCIYN